MRKKISSLKQFCRIFPELTDIPIELVYANKAASNDIPSLDLLKEYSRLQFGIFGISKLHFNAQTRFSTWVAEKKNRMLITGSFGIPATSTFIKKSFSEKFISSQKNDLIYSPPLRYGKEMPLSLVPFAIELFPQPPLCHLWVSSGDICFNRNETNMFF